MDCEPYGDLPLASICDSFFLSRPLNFVLLMVRSSWTVGNYNNWLGVSARLFAVRLVAAGNASQIVFP